MRWIESMSLQLVQVVLRLVFILALSWNWALACPDIDGLADLNCDQQLVIVCFGDSITKGVSDSLGIGYPGRIQLALPEAVVINKGVAGENTFVGLYRASGTFSSIPFADYAIVLEGVNDYWLNEPKASSTRRNVLRIRKLADDTGAGTLLGNLTHIKRSFQQSWVSAVNAELSPYRNVDFYSLGAGIISWDQIHPDSDGYDRMAELVLVELSRLSEIERPADVDQDGIYDFAEVLFGTSPELKDSDGDGLSDGLEVFQYKSSPLSLDSDGDGFLDYYEVNVLGSNPADPRPTPPKLTQLNLGNPLN